MKRALNVFQNSNNSNAKANATLEGVVVAVTNISSSHTDKSGKYWTALICDSSQNINRLTKYISSKARCSLHVKMIEYLNSHEGIKLNKLKLNGDNIYTATNETIIAPKPVSFTPSCTQTSTIKDIQDMSDGQYVSFKCKIIEIGPDDIIFFNNAQKRTQKLKRTTIAADETDSINMNLWQNQFDTIKENLSYIIKLAKVKIFNDDISITTTVHTMVEPIEDIGDVNCSKTAQILRESTVIGRITSIGSVEQRRSCPKCGSLDIESSEKTVKCISCKSRSLYSNDNFEKNKLQLNITDIDENEFTLITDIEKIRTLLEQCNHQELFEENFIEQEIVLLTLSSVNVSLNFDPKNNHVNSINIHNIEH